MTRVRTSRTHTRTAWQLPKTNAHASDQGCRGQALALSQFMGTTLSALALTSLPSLSGLPVRTRHRAFSAPTHHLATGLPHICGPAPPRVKRLVYKAGTSTWPPYSIWFISPEAKAIAMDMHDVFCKHPPTVSIMS